MASYLLMASVLVGLGSAEDDHDALDLWVAILLVVFVSLLVLAWLISL